MKTLHVRYFAILREQRGVSEEKLQTAAPDAATLYTELAAAHNFTLPVNRLRAAINGDFAPCCDHRIASGIPTYSPDFPRIYRDKIFRDEVLKTTRACSGCMYGSYPEMTIAMRYLAAKWERAKLFLAAPPAKKWPVSYERMIEIAEQIRNEDRPRITLPGSVSRLELDSNQDNTTAELA